MLEHGICERRRENDVLADRENERIPPVRHRTHLDRVCQKRPGSGEPGGAGHHDPERGTEAIATVVENRGRIAWQGHLIAHDDHRACGKGGRIIRVARRFAVGIVAIPPDPAAGLGGIAQIGFIAILPVVENDAGSGNRDGDRDDRFRDGVRVGRQNQIILADLRFRLGHEPFLRDRQAFGRGSKKKAGQRGAKPREYGRVHGAWVL